MSYVVRFFSSLSVSLCLLLVLTVCLRRSEDQIVILTLIFSVKINCSFKLLDKYMCIDVTSCFQHKSYAIFSFRKGKVK